MGEGTPSVVLDAALGGSSVSWSWVHPEIAKATRVCSYDRAGFGWSDAGPIPRTAGRMADELRSLLNRGGVPPPFVLVAHSFGGLIARVFASRYRAEITGLVFVDSAHPEDWVTPAPKEQLKIDRGLQLCRRGRAASRLGISNRFTSAPPRRSTHPRAVTATCPSSRSPVPILAIIACGNRRRSPVFPHGAGTSSRRTAATGFQSINRKSWSMPSAKCCLKVRADAGSPMSHAAL
jgi:pimeloyl-ACP methyl ester carboxylesterase